MVQIVLRNVKETIAFGEKLGKLLKAGDIIALTGELGSGKTTLVKGIASGMGVKDPSHVNSPSFVILKEHKGRIPLYHFDVYRLDDPSSMETTGYKDFFYGSGASVIEWANKIRGLLPEEYLDMELTVTGEDTRRIAIEGRGMRYDQISKCLSGK